VSRGSASGRRPELVLFDLGGVLIELSGVATMADLSGVDDERELWRRWLDCRWVRAFEAGRCSAEEFSRGVVDDWALPVSPAEFLDVFASWPVGPLDGAELLVRQTARQVPIGCLSNTNEVHWDGNAEHWPIVAEFGHRFVSHHMGRVKPDAEVFTWVADAVGVAPERVLFLDDVEVNVEGARAAGFRAERVVGVGSARKALEEHRIL
jgi:FMN phosphatase YigB (HAD superfamily)